MDKVRFGVVGIGNMGSSHCKWLNDGKSVKNGVLTAACDINPEKIENIKNNAIDSVKAAVENGELSISTANEIAKHNTTKQQEIISSPIEKIKTADVRSINKTLLRMAKPIQSQSSIELWNKPTEKSKTVGK